MTATAPLAQRLHHTAYLTKDQEATRAFYEDILGFPLLATWSEADELFGALRVYCHTFFGLADGSALAFFQFAEKEDAELFGPKMPMSPFHHIALNVDKEFQAGVEKRLTEAAKITERYRRPNFGTMEIEITVDDPKAYTKPFTIKVTEVLNPDSDVLENVCAENEKDREHMQR